jgi:uncharacterized membrane protein YhfC
VSEGTVDVLVRFVNPLLMITMPLALGVILARRLGVEWRLFGIGAATFVGSQVVHLPFNVWALRPAVEWLGLGGAHMGLSLALVALLFGLSAGLSEEVARYVVYRAWLKDARAWRQALMFGAGHGGIEAILLGGLALYALIQALVYRHADLSALLPPAQLAAAQAQLEAFWAAPWYEALLGAVERAFALFFHLSASVLVLQAFTRRNLVWLGLAIGWHTLVNSMAVFALGAWGVYVAEGLTGLAALASLGVIFALRTPEEGRTDAAPAVIAGPMPSAASAPVTVEGDVSAERLEDSRFLE